MDSAISQPCPIRTVWPRDKGAAEAPFVPCSGAPESLHLGPLKPSLVSSFSSETGKCLSRAKASPRAQLSCSKAGSVESCSLSCPAHTHFLPGNSGCPRGGGEGWGLPSLGSSPCPLLSSKKEPHLRTRGPQPWSLSDSEQLSGSLWAARSLSTRAVGPFLPNHLPCNRVAETSPTESVLTFISSSFPSEAPGVRGRWGRGAPRLAHHLPLRRLREQLQPELRRPGSPGQAAAEAQRHQLQLRAQLLR